MNNRVEDIEALELQDITAEELHAIAGGPQVTNDGISIISPEEVAAVAGGPEVLNDGPPT